MSSRQQTLRTTGPAPWPRLRYRHPPAAPHPAPNSEPPLLPNSEAHTPDVRHGLANWDPPWPCQTSGPFISRLSLSLSPLESALDSTPEATAVPLPGGGPGTITASGDGGPGGERPSETAGGAGVKRSSDSAEERSSSLCCAPHWGASALEGAWVGSGLVQYSRPRQKQAMKPVPGNGRRQRHTLALVPVPGQVRSLKQHQQRQGTKPNTRSR